MDAELSELRLVDDVMRQWPAVIGVFLKHRLHCVGCPIGRLHTIRDACVEHQVDLDPFMADLQTTIAALFQPRSRQSPDALPSAIISSL
jgi:hybrid cluster-associated redox disulfide protein